MSRVMTFSRTYPAYHPKAGQPTHFVEKILNWYFGTMKNLEHNPALHFTGDIIKLKNPELYQVGGVETFIESLSKDIDAWKNHTIRAGRRWKAGDWFSPRVWSGKPYNSKQVIIAPDIQVKKTWDFEVDGNGVMSMAKPGEQLKYLDENIDAIIAKNDGLEYNDFIDWIVLPYYVRTKDSGPMQIICWNESIEYKSYEDEWYERRQEYHEQNETGASD